MGPMELSRMEFDGVQEAPLEQVNGTHGALMNKNKHLYLTQSKKEQHVKKAPPEHKSLSASQQKSSHEWRESENSSSNSPRSPIWNQNPFSSSVTS